MTPATAMPQAGQRPWGLPARGRLARLLRGQVRRVVSPWLQLWLRRHSLRPRQWRHGSLSLWVEPGVFPPGPTLSTASFLDWLLSPEGPGPWPGQRVLDLGCGCGAIGLVMAAHGAQVIASDINPAAAANAAANARANALGVTVVVADLLAGLRTDRLDMVLINPPYYPQQPQGMAERAWFCGPGFEYFHALFAQLRSLDLQRTQVLMVVSEDCHEPGLRQAAQAQGLQLQLRGSRRRWLEWALILRVLPA